MDTFDKIASAIFGVLLAIGLIAVTASLASSGRADFCYLRAVDGPGSTRYILEAHRPWRPDMIIGVYDNILEPATISVGMACPLFTQPELKRELEKTPITAQ